MIILPTEKSFDWQHAPLVLIGVVLLNVFIFFFYQSGDAAKFEKAYIKYESSGLLEIEWPLYKEYLIAKGDTDLAEEYESYMNEEPLDEDSYTDDYYTDENYADENYTDEYSEEDFSEMDLFGGDITWLILADFDFKRHLMEKHRDMVPDEVYYDWKPARTEVNNALESVSFYRFGLVPTDLSVIDFISSQFLHGDVMHLLGNMFFLLICGFAVEAALGHLKFLMFYLLTGIFAGAAQVLTDLSSSIPSLGASGAISGVMAMYLGVFRFKKIEFFYWFFVFVGYFRAPAMLILPFYVGNEVYSFMFNEGSNVAFMAHAGGFVSGAILIAGNQILFPKTINEEYIEADQNENPYQEKLAKVYRAIESYQFSSAIKTLQEIIDEHGIDFRLAQLRYNLSKIEKNEKYSGYVSDLVRIKTDALRELDLLKQVWQENPGVIDSLSEKDNMDIAMRFCNQQQFSISEAIFKHLHKNKTAQSDLAILARKLAAVAQELKEPKKQRAYENFIKNVVGA